MKSVYIIGSGGMARELLFFFRGRKELYSSFRGFIALNDGEVTIGSRSFKVISEQSFFDHFLENKNVDLYLGLGDPKIIARVKTRFNGFNFPNFIHPSAVLDVQDIQIGKGNIIGPGAIVTTNCRLGNFNVLNRSSSVGHDCTIGDLNVINPGVIVSGSVSIGDENLIGTNSTILQNLRIGSGNTLGAAALLTKDMSNNMTFVGVPARPLIR